MLEIEVKSLGIYNNYPNIPQYIILLQTTKVYRIDMTIRHNHTFIDLNLTPNLRKKKKGCGARNAINDRTKIAQKGRGCYIVCMPDNDDTSLKKNMPF